MAILDSSTRPTGTLAVADVFGQLSLDEVKAVKNAYCCTVNDVVVSICAGAVRRWLVAHDELPGGPLVAQIPVSVRTDEQVGTFGNRIILMSAPLFTDEAEPRPPADAHATSPTPTTSGSRSSTHQASSCSPSVRT